MAGFMDNVLPVMGYVRWLAVWQSFAWMPFALLGAFSILGIVQVCLDAVAFIFNLTVAIKHHKAKKRCRLLGTEMPPVKAVVWSFDIFFGLVFSATFILYMVAYGIAYEEGGAYVSAFSGFGSVGALVAA